MFFGFLLITVGVVFLLQNLGVVTGSAWKIIWPVFIIIFGLIILSKPDRSKKMKENRKANRS